jgi:hypothetical protein
VGQVIAVRGLPVGSEWQATESDRLPHRQSKQYWV